MAFNGTAALPTGTTINPATFDGEYAEEGQTAFVLWKLYDSRTRPTRVLTGWGPADFAYDPATGTVTSDPAAIRRLERAGSVAPRSLGEETWKWLYLQPLLARD